MSFFLTIALFYCFLFNYALRSISSHLSNLQAERVVAHPPQSSSPFPCLPSEPSVSNVRSAMSRPLTSAQQELINSAVQVSKRLYCDAIYEIKKTCE